MFSLDEIMTAFGLALHWQIVVSLASGIGLGILVGSLPGLTTAAAMAMVLPISFFLDPLIGIPFLIGLYKGGIYGGSIPAILIATPGTGASVATTFDGPALVRKGCGRKALDMALYASVVGDTASDIFTLLLIAPIAALALLAGPPELAVVLFLSIAIAVLAGSAPWTHGVIMACGGILLATIGQDPLEFTPRLSFGLDMLANGIPLLPMLVGLFAVPEIARMFFDNTAGAAARPNTTSSAGPPLTLGEFKAVTSTLLRSSGLGTILGIVPGIGQPVAAFMGYSLAKKASRTPEQFGRGSLDGIAAAEASNNAVNGPTLVPLLTLGIPGDKITAILLGAFVAQGLRPGPELIQNQGPIVLAILFAMLFGNILLLLVAKLLIPIVARIVTVRKELLAPIILVLAMTGAYLHRSESGDLTFLAVFGMIGIFARRAEFDLAPLVLAFILCESLEYSVAQTLNLARNGFVDFFFYERPGALLILLSAVSIMTWIRLRRGTI